ncbi:MAG: TatD family hydrolase [Victivallales bacterium]|nr:TatD family hydrolase [Victivallales bacterium]
MTLPVIDCHAHLADGRLLPRLHEVLERSRRNGLVRVLANAARLSEFDSIAAMASADVKVAFGIHPFWPEEWPPARKALEEALKANPAASVGEIGLDFYSGRDNQQAQETAFAEQLTLALEYGRPVCLHNRKAWQQFFGILKTLRVSGLRGYMHNFTGSREIASKLLDLGLHISFAAPVTYPEAHRLREVSVFIPTERLLTETDCPDLPYAKGELTEPWQAANVLHTLASAHGISTEALAEQVWLNFNNVFELEDKSCSRN